MNELLLAAALLVNQHSPAEQRLHEQFYSTWKSPRSGRISSCCNLGDCYPTIVRWTGKWQYHDRDDAEWRVVPEEVIEQNQSDPRDSPDHQNHVCVAPRPDRRVRCFTFGSGQ